MPDSLLPCALAAATLAHDLHAVSRSWANVLLTRMHPDCCGTGNIEAALALGRRNAELNGVEVEFIKADIKPFMQEAAAAGHAWDVIILDPPKLAPNRKSLNKATNKCARAPAATPPAPCESP